MVAQANAQPTESVSKPVLVICPGICHSADFFAQFETLLASHGYESLTVQYPTVSADPAEVQSASLREEIGTIRACVEAILEGREDQIPITASTGHITHQKQPRNVVLLAHSYGGMPGSRSILGLDRDTRRAQGRATGIIEVIFLSAFLIPEDALIAPYATQRPWMDHEHGCYKINEKALAALFSDLPPEEAAKWLSRTKSHRVHLDDPEARLPFAPWKLSVPKTYILATEDRTIPPQAQLLFLQDIDIDGTWMLKTIKTGHEPFLSNPQRLAEVVLGGRAAATDWVEPR